MASSTRFSGCVWHARLLLTSALLCGMGWSVPSRAVPGPVLQDVLRLDAGPAASAGAKHWRKILVASQYDPAVGYGWTTAPTESFVRDNLALSRDAMTIDGVSGKRLDFRADLQPGRWRIVIWIEAGNEDESTLSLTMQGEHKRLGWHGFRPPSEPRPAIQKIYRVYQGDAVVKHDGLRISLAGGDDLVRLLGLSLVRKVEAVSAPQLKAKNKITEIARYNGETSVEVANDKLAELFDDRPDDPYLERCRLQLQLLARAERLFHMRGWHWADEQTNLSLFDRLHQAVMLLDGLIGAEPDLSDPLSERGLYIRGRLLYWLSLERRHKATAQAAQRDLRRLLERYPNDLLLQMYTGTRVDLPDACDCIDVHGTAPKWSRLQFEALCRLRRIIHWWVEERQAENGELGGKLGDDVEILRWWEALVLAGDAVTQSGWQRLADGVWHSNKVHQGYARHVSDVEHASEFIADTAPLMPLFKDEPEYLDRLRHSARHFEDLWTAVTPRGHRFFRSSWYSSSAVETEEPKGRDTEYNCRAVKALRFLAWRAEDARVIDLLEEWSAAWLSAALRTDKGKPRGIIPPSVRFPDEAINGDQTEWYRANMFWPYFDWEQSDGSRMLDQLLFTYSMTDDPKFLQPMFLALELIRSEGPSASARPERADRRGSLSWTAQRLAASELFWHVVAHWRFLTGDAQWDDLLMKYGSPYARFRISRDPKHLEHGLEKVLESVRYNTPLLTTEAIHTDRVYVPGAAHLKAMLSGAGFEESLSPYFAVSWENTFDEFTALVADSGRTRLNIEVFSHSSEKKQVTMRIWQLEAGEYMLTLRQGEQRQTRKIAVTARGERIEIVVPGKTLLAICIEANS